MRAISTHLLVVLIRTASQVPCASITKTDKEYIWEGYHFSLAQVHSSKDGDCQRRPRPMGHGFFSVYSWL